MNVQCCKHDLIAHAAHNPQKKGIRARSMYPDQACSQDAISQVPNLDLAFLHNWFLLHSGQPMTGNEAVRLDVV
jgi:hypothetical protein